MSEQSPKDIVALAEENGAEFSFDESRGWHWNHKDEVGFLNGPCETQEEAAAEFMEANTPEDDIDDEVGSDDLPTP